MAEPHSMLTREEAVRQYLGKEGTYDQVAARLKIGSASVKRWVALQRAGQSLVPRPKGGSKPKLTVKALELIRGLVLDEPNWTTTELADEVYDALQIRVSRQNIGRALKAMKITFKRGSSDPKLPENRRTSPGEKRTRSRSLDSTRGSWCSSTSQV